MYDFTQPECDEGVYRACTGAVTVIPFILTYFIYLNAMPGRIPLNILQDIILEVRNGWGNKTIARHHFVSKNTVKSIRTRLETTGRPYLQRSVTQGRPRDLLPYQEEVCMWC